MTGIDLAISAAKVVVVFAATMIGVMALTLAERRVSAFLQGRLGPNRVGPWGLLQPLADGIKFLMKEDVVPGNADRFLFVLSPALLLIPALMTFAVIPFGSSLTIFGKSVPLQVADVNVGLLYILALTSIGVYGIVLAGWSSNSKYSLLGGLRSSAQLISYELPMGLAVISVVLIAGTLRLNEMVAAQQGGLLTWNIFRLPLTFLLFLVTAFAETNRLPFDLAESEQELVAGYHTEYSSLKFAMFFMAEYANMITASALMVVLFFGGWDIPWVDEAAMGNWGAVASVISFAMKMTFFLFLYIWVRWTLPRFRYDQLMRLGWKVLLPLAVGNLVVVGASIAYGN